MKILTNSQVDRKTILDDDRAITEIQKHIDVEGISYENQIIFTKQMTAQIYGVEEKIIDSYISDNLQELIENGYQVIEDKKLIDFISSINRTNSNTTNLPKFSTLHIFNYKAFLNIGMLIIESQSAKLIRHRILDIMIDLINIQTNGLTKYINQKHDYISQFPEVSNHTTNICTALKNYTNVDSSKYLLYINKILNIVFNSHIAHIQNKKEIFRLEILKLFNQYVNIIVNQLTKKFDLIGSLLNHNETEEVFLRVESQAQSKQETESNQPIISNDDYDNLFINILKDNQDVLLRLKER